MAAGALAACLHSARSNTAVATTAVPEGVFLVPQRAYSAPGSLAEQITYPHIVPKAERDEALLAEVRPDSNAGHQLPMRLRSNVSCVFSLCGLDRAQILDRVGVGYLVEQFAKEGGLA